MSVEEAPRPVHPFEDFRTSGLLWLINRTTFHPRGFAMGLEYGDDATNEQINAGEVEPIGWRLYGDGTEPWSFETDREAEIFRAVETFFDALRPDGGHAR